MNSEMTNVFCISILFVIPALISTVLYLRTGREKSSFSGILRIVVFFGICFLGVLTTFKCLTGYGMRTLWESYAEIQIITYIHYGIPLLIAALVLVAVLRLLFREKADMFIEGFTSFFFLCALLLFLLFGKITNIVFLATAVVCGVVTLFKILQQKERARYNDLKEIRENILFLIMPIAFFMMTLIIYIPHELFISNMSEFPISYTDYLRSLLLQCLMVFLVFLPGLILLTKEHQKLSGIFIFGITLCGYLQSNFLNGSLQILDGQHQKWPMWQKIFNVLIWAAIIGGIVFLLVKYEKKVVKAVKWGALYLCLIQLVSLTVLLATANWETEEELVLTKKGLLELNEENNILIFVLDWYDQQIMDWVFDREPALLEQLESFVWYQNVVSQYSFTDMALPYLLTGIPWEYDMLEAEYCQYAHERSDWLERIHEQGYDIGIYTYDQYMLPSQKEMIINMESQKEACDYIKTAQFADRSARYRFSPFWSKHLYYYDTSDLEDLRVAGYYYSVGKDHEMYEALQQDGISIEKEDKRHGSFRIYHMMGAHAPYELNAAFQEDVSLEEKVGEEEALMQQATASFKIVLGYLRQLKDHGIYDDTTIIITADHGQNLYMEEEEKGLGPVSTPIMFVKRSGEEGGKKIKYSNAPVSHAEIMPSVLEESGTDEALIEGRPFWEWQEGENRERKMIYGRHYDVPFVEYTINGHVRDLESWNAKPMRE